MPIEVGIGFSQDLRTPLATREAALEAKSRISNQSIRLILLFSTVHHHPSESLPIIRKTFPEAKILGCSTFGLFLADMITLQGIGLAAFSGNDFECGIACVEDLLNQDKRSAGVHLARTMFKNFEHSKRACALIITDSLVNNCMSFLLGTQEILGRLLPIIGGCASDNFRFRNTFQFYQEKSLKKSAVGLVLGGDLTIGFGSRHGFKPLGKPHFVNKSIGERILEIDRQRSSLIYEKYLEMDLPTLRKAPLNQITGLYPLGFSVEGQDEFLLRNSLSVNREGHLICRGEVPQGHNVHMMIGNKDYCLQAVREAASIAKKSLKGKTPRIVIVFEAASRYKLFRKQAFQEIHSIREIFGPAVPLLGLYTYGEFSSAGQPHQTQQTIINNETVNILAIA